MRYGIPAAAVAAGAALILSACGGGGGDGGGSGGAAGATTPVTVAPSLGRFSGPCTASIRRSSGELLASGPLGADGTVTLTVSGYGGPIIVQVEGANGCTYYDEATQNPAVPFGAGQTLRAVADTPRSEIGVNLLTELAASQLIVGGQVPATQTEIRRQNATVGLMFGTSAILDRPTLVAGPAQIGSATTEADRFALLLAALSEAALAQGRSITDYAGDLRQGLAAGTLPLTPADFRQHLANAATRNAASPAVDTQLQQLATATTFEPSASAVQTRVSAILTAGTELAQAKQLFADIRSNLLSLWNPAGGGTLNNQYAVLRQDVAASVWLDRYLETLTLLQDAAVHFFVDGQTQPLLDPSRGECSLATQTTVRCVALDAIRYDAYVITLALTGPGSASWSVDQAVEGTGGAAGLPSQLFHGMNWVTVQSFTGRTGTITRNGNTSTLRGTLHAGTADTDRSAVDLTLTHVPGAGQQTWNGGGTIDFVRTDGTSQLLSRINSLAISEAAGTANLDLSMISLHHRFDGVLELAGVLRDPSSDSVEPRSARLTGSFTDTANAFKVFDGTLTGAQDWTGYDPSQPTSAGNFAKVTIGFAGTLYKSANVPGIAFTLNGDNLAGPDAQKLNMSFTGSNALTVSGTGTQAGAGWNWALSNGNGIRASYSDAQRSGQVTKADGTVLGTLNEQRVSFIDGSFQSLF